MRHHTFAVTLVTSLFPLLASAAPALAPCDLMDRQTLAALALGNAETKVEHKAVAATAQAPAHTTDTCTITPKTGATSSLTVMVVTQSGGMSPSKAMCTDKVEGKIGMTFCSAIIQRNLVNVALVSQVATFPKMNAAVRARVERLAADSAAKQ